MKKSDSLFCWSGVCSVACLVAVLTAREDHLMVSAFFAVFLLAVGWVAFLVGLIVMRHEE